MFGEVHAHMADVRRMWADRIRTERRAQGWDQPEMARRLAHAAGDARSVLPDHESLVTYVKRWERAAVRMSERYRLLYARAFGIAEEKLFGAGEDMAASPWSPPGVELDGRLTPDDEERLVVAVRAPRRQDPAAVGALATVLDGQRRTEDVIGSAPLIEPVNAQLAIVEDLVTEARGDLRPDVVRLGAQWAQFTAWLHANTGQLGEARRLYGQALEWATEADDADMIATALNMQGHAAWLGGKIGPMVGLSRAAQRDTRASAGVLALAAQQEARGRALMGDSETTSRKLDEAAVLAGEAAERPEDEPPWVYFYSPAFLTMQRGLAYRFLGRNAEAEGDEQGARRWYGKAVEMLEAGLSGMPADMRNADWVGSYLYQLAATHAAAGDVVQASARAREAAVIARQTTSSRLDGDLQRLAVRLSEWWPGHPAVAEVLDVLR